MAKKKQKTVIQKPIGNDFESRKAFYKARRQVLLKKVGDLTTLCDIDACVILFGPGDDAPIVWPSDDETKDMIDQFEDVPSTGGLRKNVTPRVYIERANNKLEIQLMELKNKNDEKVVSNFMHEIHHGGKSLSDFDASHISRLLCYVEEKLKGVRVKAGSSEEHQQLPLSPPKPPTPQLSSPPIQNIEQVSQQQSSFDDLSKTDEITNAGFGDVAFPASCNFGGLTNYESDSGFGVVPQSDFIFTNGNNNNNNSDSGLFYGSSSGGIGGDNDIWSSSYGNFGGTFAGNDDHMMLPFNNNFQSNINESFMGIGQHYDGNQGGFINNIGFGANNDGVAIGRFNIPNFVGTSTNGGNFNLGFASHANLASNSGCKNEY